MEHQNRSARSSPFLAEHSPPDAAVTIPPRETSTPLGTSLCYMGNPNLSRQCCVRATAPANPLAIRWDSRRTCRSRFVTDKLGRRRLIRDAVLVGGCGGRVPGTSEFLRNGRSSPRQSWAISGVPPVAPMVEQLTLNRELPFSPTFPQAPSCGQPAHHQMVKSNLIWTHLPHKRPNFRHTVSDGSIRFAEPAFDAQPRTPLISADKNPLTPAPAPQKSPP